MDNEGIIRLAKSICRRSKEFLCDAKYDGFTQSVGGGGPIKLDTDGLVRLLASRTAGRLYLVCFRRRFLATITGTEDFVTM